MFESPACDAVRDAAGGLRGLAVIERGGRRRRGGGHRARAAGERGRAERPGGARGRCRAHAARDAGPELLRTVVFTGLAGRRRFSRPWPPRPDPRRRRAPAGRQNALQVRLPLAEQRADETLLLFAFACEAGTATGSSCSRRAPTPRPDGRACRRGCCSSSPRSVAGRPVGLDEFLSGKLLASVWRRHGGGLPAFPGTTPRPKTIRGPTTMPSRM